MKNLELAATSTGKGISMPAMESSSHSVKNSDHSEVRAQAGKYLTFTLHSESYGVGVLKIREIIRLQEITIIPQMPQYVKGVINLRGKIIPILDLRIKFGLPAETSDSTCIIVVQLEGIKAAQTQIGLIVDGVEEVIHISASDIEEAPHFGSSISAKYIIGIAKIKGVVKILVDIDSVIGTEAAEIIKHINK